MQNLQETTLCGYVSLTPDNVVLEASPTAEAWLGYDEGELDGKLLDLPSSPGTDLGILVLRTKNGEPLPVLAQSESDGNVVNCVFLLLPKGLPKVDNPARSVRKEELSKLSHNLRTPLQAIGFSTYILAEGESGPVTEMQKQDLKRISDASREVNSIINEILQVAQME